MSTCSGSYAESHTLWNLDTRSHHSGVLLKKHGSGSTNNSGKLDSWDHEYFRQGSYSNSMGVALTNRSGSTNTQGSAAEPSLGFSGTTNRRLQITKDQLLAYQLHANDINFVMDQKDYINNANSPQHLLFADHRMVLTNMVAGYTIRAPLTTENLSLLIYYAHTDTDARAVVLRLLPNFVNSVHVSRFLNEWYLTLGINPPVRHRLWLNPHIANEFIKKSATNIASDAHRASLARPATLPANVPGVLYPVDLLNIDVTMDGHHQRRMGLVYPDYGYKTVRDYFHARVLARAAPPDKNLGASLRLTISELSGDNPILNRLLIRNNLGSGGFDDLSNRVSQLPKLGDMLVDILRDMACVARTLSVCHELGIVHNGVTGHHILRATSLPNDVDPHSSAVVLTGWDFAFTIAGEDLSEAFRRRNILEIPDLLPYMSPENTGETTNLVDYRLDFYSFGIVLYELVVGCLPFQSESPARLRKMHWNEKPIAPMTLCQGWLPQKVSDIIMRCLEKSPDDRYREAHSLCGDLLGVVAELMEQEGMGEQDQVHEQISACHGKLGKLPYYPVSITKYTSDSINQQVIECFANHSDGLKYIFVKGASGVGKSTLINEIQITAVSKYNFFIPWSYNCTDMNVSKYALAMHGLQTLTSQILSLSKENIAEWRHTFTSEIDVDMSILFQSIPDLEVLLGPRYKSLRSENDRTVYPSKEMPFGFSSSSLTDVLDSDEEKSNKDDVLPTQTDVFKQTGFEEQNIELQLAYIIKRVFSLVAARGLTVVLDGLQWCPLNEFHLIRDIAQYCLSSGDAPNICVVGAYNTLISVYEEAYKFHSNYVSLDAIKQILVSDEVEVCEFELENLNAEQFDEFIKDGIFPRSADIVLNDALKEAIFERSSGNRLNFNILMRYLHLTNASEQLNFGEMDEYLRRDCSPETQMEIVQKYFDFGLTKKETDVLKFASLIGAKGLFKLSDLMIVTGQSLLDVYEALQVCIEIGLIVPSGTYYKMPFHLITNDDFPFEIPDFMIWDLTTRAKYRFEHDALQLYLLNQMQSSNEWAELHRLCGLRYQKKSMTDVNVNIANYLSLCTHLVYSADIAKPEDQEKYYETLVTGGRYALATSNLETALEFFKVAAKFINPDDKRRMIKSMLTICLTYYLLRRYEDCIAMISTAEEKFGRESRLFMFLKIRCFFHLKQHKSGIKRAVEALQSLDVEVSLDQSKCESIARKYLTSIPLSVSEIRGMKNLKKATSQKFLLIATLISDLLGPTYILGLAQLRLALMTQMIALMNQYGQCANCALPLLHFANYYIQPHEHMSTVKATELSKIALDLINSEEGASTSLSQQINECYIIFMALFRTNTNELLRFSDYYDFTTTGVVRPRESSLSVLVVASGFLLNFLNGNTSVIPTSQALLKIVQFDSDEEYEVFDSALKLWQNDITYENYAKEYSKYHTMSRPDLEFPYLANAILWCMAEGRYKEGGETFLERGYHSLRKLPVSILHSEVYFYASICMCFNESPATKIAGIQLAKRIMKVFENWSNACYGNFGPKRLILNACIKCSSSTQSSLSLLDLFEEAIESATKEGRWIDVALANHLCASWLLRTSESERRAGYFAQNALSMYLTMKADRQVERVRKEFASVFSRFNWAGVEMIQELSKALFGDSTQLNRKLQHIFNGSQSSSSKQQPATFRVEGANSVDIPGLDHGDSRNEMATLSDLARAIKLCLTISESSNIDSIVSSLLESILQFSGVDYGVIVLNSQDDEPSVRAIGTLNNLYKLDNDPLSTRTDLVPYMLAIHCLLTGEVINKEANLKFFDERFGTDHYYLHNPCSSAIAIPIKTSSVLGMVYLERHAPNREVRSSRLQFDSKMIDLLDLLCSQAAVAFSKLIVYSQMEIAKKTAEDATAEKASFLANMSHEIRTPFNSLFACSVFLLDTELSATQREYVETIKNSALVTLSIIDGILAFSKIEHGSFNLDMVPFSINDTVESAIQVSSEQAETNNLELVFFNDCPNIASVIGDPTRFRQIIINLVGNAVKFTLSGHIIVTLDAEEITKNRYEIKVIVEDTGIGIPLESRSKVFGAFSQVDGSSRRVYGGSGLGLAISKKLADIMNGSITFESTEGEGSVFCFSCPLEVTLTERTPLLEPQNIAIVTKLELRKRSLKSFLEFYGSKVTIFDSIEHLSSSGKNFSIIFIGNSVLGSAKVQRSKLPFSKCKIYLVAPFGLVFSEMSLENMEVDAIVFTPIIRTKVEEILRNFSKNNSAPKPLLPGTIELLSATYPLRILIAEDNVINLRVALQHLKKLGYIADHAKDGIEAFERCEAKLMTGDKYDVIFMDIQMPRKDGIAATIDIHERFYSQGRPDLLPRIIALTANVAGEDREKCLECGMVDFVSKPILPEELRRVLTRVGEEMRVDNF